MKRQVIFQYIFVLTLFIYSGCLYSQYESRGERYNYTDAEAFYNVGNYYDALPLYELLMQEISLNDIQHGILRPIWKDPRVHFVLSTGALSGANIQKTAFTGDNNEELLEKAKAKFMQHPKAVRVEGNLLVLNSVFEWYASDFGENRSAVLAYIRENTSDAMRQAMDGLSRISFDYNWDLNTFDAQSDLAFSGASSE